MAFQSSKDFLKYLRIFTQSFARGIHNQTIDICFENWYSTVAQKKKKLQMFLSISVHCECDWSLRKSLTGKMYTVNKILI